MTLLPYLHGIELSEEKQNKIRLFTAPAPAREVSLIHSKSQLKMPIISALRSTISSIIRGAIKFDNIKVIPPKKNRWKTNFKKVLDVIWHSSVTIYKVWLLPVKKDKKSLY